MLRRAHSLTRDPHISHRLRRSRQDMAVMLSKALRLVVSTLYFLPLYSRSQPALFSNNRSPPTSNNHIRQAISKPSRAATYSPNRPVLASHFNRTG